MATRPNRAGNGGRHRGYTQTELDGGAAIGCRGTVKPANQQSSEASPAASAWRRAVGESEPASITLVQPHFADIGDLSVAQLHAIPRSRSSQRRVSIIRRPVDIPIRDRVTADLAGQAANLVTCAKQWPGQRTATLLAVSQGSCLQIKGLSSSLDLVHFV